MLLATQNTPVKNWHIQTVGENLTGNSRALQSLGKVLVWFGLVGLVWVGFMAYQPL